MMSKSFLKKVGKFLAKVDIKTNFLSIFPRLNQGINPVCKCDIEFCDEWTEKVCETVLKFVGWLGGELSLHESVKMVSDLPTTRKRTKRKKRFQKFVILWLRLLENHTIVAKIISLFVEKKLPLEYLFLSERSCWTKAKRNDFRESYISCFMENLSRKGFLKVKD